LKKIITAEHAEVAENKRMEINNDDGFVKSLVLVFARSSAFAGRRSNLVFSGTYKKEIASSASGGLAMTLSWLLTSSSIIKN